MIQCSIWIFINRVELDRIQVQVLKYSISRSIDQSSPFLSFWLMATDLKPFLTLDKTRCDSLATLWNLKYEPPFGVSGKIQPKKTAIDPKRATFKTIMFMNENWSMNVHWGQPLDGPTDDVRAHFQWWAATQLVFEAENESVNNSTRKNWTAVLLVIQARSLATGRSGITSSDLR